MIAATKLLELSDGTTVRMYASPPRRIRVDRSWFKHLLRQVSQCPDEAPAYGPLCMTHVHQAVDHSKGYVVGSVHVNGMENFWSLLKRTIKGTYVAVAPYTSAGT